ncbi:hypothetical protein POM88_000245 [Heracleum sosnowskyi]|uniref:Uncharacterized protein n=1 Tax=Heracleum sosnowskyi TaxID=360622 RepID=A0AAD8J9Z2_9APIA|nr:hypothetical protein POM88_000245 [Heracleum sosnowskyi]
MSGPLWSMSISIKDTVLLSIFVFIMFNVITDYQDYENEDYRENRIIFDMVTILSNAFVRASLNDTSDILRRSKRQEERDILRRRKMQEEEEEERHEEERQEEERQQPLTPTPAPTPVYEERDILTSQANRIPDKQAGRVPDNQAGRVPDKQQKKVKIHRGLVSPHTYLPRDKRTTRCKLPNRYSDGVLDSNISEG